MLLGQGFNVEWIQSVLRDPDVLELVTKQFVIFVVQESAQH